MSRRTTVVLVLLALFAVAGTAAYALINPNFTPVQLVERADLILVLKIKAPDDNSGRCTMEVVKCIKGKMPAKRQVLDLNNAANQEHAKAVRAMLAANNEAPVLFFAGKGEKDEPLARLHVGGKWIALEKAAATAAKPESP
jgi:hypothetical protein